MAYPPVPRPRSARPGMYPDEIFRGIGTGLHKNANGLIGLGMGLLQGKDFAEGLALGGQNFMQGTQLDQQRNAYEKEEQRLNDTEQRLKDQFPALYEKYMAGAPMEAVWNAAMKGDAQGFTLGAGETRYAADGSLIAQGPDKLPTPTDDMREYEMAKQQGYTGSFVDYQTEMRKAGATNIDLNANQGAAAAYADRMVSADAVLSDPMLTEAMTSLVEQGKAGVPIAGNFLVSKEFQMAEQAQRDFVNAVLRRESGAVISPSEFENAKKQYFPQPGDTPEVIVQKARNRKTAIAGVSRAAGSNYSPPSLTGGYTILSVE